jgi:hypothetical protein
MDFRDRDDPKLINPITEQPWGVSLPLPKATGSFPPAMKILQPEPNRAMFRSERALPITNASKALIPFPTRANERRETDDPNAQNDTRDKELPMRLVPRSDSDEPSVT